MEVFDSKEWLSKNGNTIYLKPNCDTWDSPSMIKQLIKFAKMCLANKKKVGREAEYIYAEEERLFVTDSYKLMSTDLVYMTEDTSIKLFAVWDSQEVLKALDKAELFIITKSQEFVTQAGTQIRVVKPLIDAKPISINSLIENLYKTTPHLGETTIDKFHAGAKWKAVGAVKDIECYASCICKRGTVLMMNTKFDGVLVPIELGDMAPTEWNAEIGINRHWLKSILETLDKNIKLTVGNYNEALRICNDKWTCLLMPMEYKAEEI